MTRSNNTCRRVRGLVDKTIVNGCTIGSAVSAANLASRIITDQNLDALEATRFEHHEKAPSGRTAFAVGYVDGQDLAPPVPVDANRDQHRPAHDDAVRRAIGSLDRLLVRSTAHLLGSRAPRMRLAKGSLSGLSSSRLLIAEIDEAEKA